MGIKEVGKEGRGQNVYPLPLLLNFELLMPFLSASAVSFFRYLETVTPFFQTLVMLLTWQYPAKWQLQQLRLQSCQFHHQLQR